MPPPRTFFRERYFSTLLEVAPLDPATVTLDPPAATNPVGTSHTVTATVTNVVGQPTAGYAVKFTVMGSVSKTGTCTTNAQGQCSFTYTGPTLPGADLIRGCVDADKDGLFESTEPCGEATKSWLLPATQPGQVTGGGQVPGAATGDVAFGFNAKSDQNGTNGNCTVVDPATDTQVKCLNVTVLTRSGTHATLFGNATVNGVATTYRIDVDDLGEPGAGRDTFTIQTASGFSAGGVLLRGNIQIHT